MNHHTYRQEVEDVVRFLQRLGLLGRDEFYQALHRLEKRMGAREDAAYEALNSHIAAVKDGWASLVAERDHYKTALEEADAAKAQAVQDALDADSDVDAAKVEAADAALSELLNVSNEGGDTPPVDDSGADTGAGDGGTVPDQGTDVTDEGADTGTGDEVPNADETENGAVDENGNPV